ncbi:MAG TPA: hypothetical protein VJR89_23620 [Polyangiales bacterium]|nr:hypothetical protein [Polyangiales bacterium]
MKASLLVLAALGFAACTDPGCIRNSECSTEQLCINHVCVVPPPDGGKRAGEDDAGSE